MTLCSSECPCNITSQMHDEFKTNNFSKEFIDNIVDGGNVTSFQECPDDAIAKVKTFYEQDEKSSQGKLSNLNINNFVKYWKYVENKFDCVGWCANSYWYTGNFTNVYVNGGLCKYLFSGVNKGVPKHAGCLNEMFKHVKSNLQTCGYIALVCACSMFITWIAGLVICCKLRQSFMFVSEIEENNTTSSGGAKQKKKKIKRSETKMTLNEEKKIKNKSKKQAATTTKRTKRNKDNTIDLDTNDNNNNTQGNVPTVKTYTDLNTERKFKHNNYLSNDTSESITKKTHKKIKKKKK